MIGIDLGARRIGIAVSESGLIATPHSVIRNEGDVAAKLSRLGDELGVDVFVVGIPRRAGAGSSSGERKYREFAESLRQKSCKPVVLWDETLTTVEAAGQLREAGIDRRTARDEIDKYAATVILQSWLDARGRSA